MECVGPQRAQASHKCPSLSDYPFTLTRINALQKILVNLEHENISGLLAMKIFRMFYTGNVSMNHLLSSLAVQRTDHLNVSLT